jgi:hypothetical protein
MANKRAVADEVHGVELVERVIEKVKVEGFGALGTCGLPKEAKARPIAPAVLEGLRFPDGSVLSPALRRWLAFDGSWLGWFEDLEKPVFRGRKLGRYARDEYGMDWGYGSLEKKVGGDCFGVHFGSDSRRFLYVGKPDSVGEHPVLLVDTDDSPYLGVEYPGIDVYLAVHAGVIEMKGRGYGSLRDDARYGRRMEEHARINLGGEANVEVEFGGGEGDEDHGTDEDVSPANWKDGDPIPKGYAVGINPFTKEKVLRRKPE